MLSTFMMLGVNRRGGDLADNYLAVDGVLRARPAAKDKYLKSVTLAASMRPRSRPRSEPPEISEAVSVKSCPVTWAPRRR